MKLSELCWLYQFDQLLASPADLVKIRLQVHVKTIRPVVGMAAGGLGQLFASPADLVKIRLQVPYMKILSELFWLSVQQLDQLFASPVDLVKIRLQVYL
jgi:hypothetical protein